MEEVDSFNEVREMSQLESSTHIAHIIKTLAQAFLFVALGYAAILVSLKYEA